MTRNCQRSTSTNQSDVNLRVAVGLVHDDSDRHSVYKSAVHGIHCLQASPKFTTPRNHETQKTGIITMHQKERTEPKEATIATMGNAFSALTIEDKLEVTTSFHLFPRFPTEIRFQIWRRAIEALPGRIVTV